MRSQKLAIIFSAAVVGGCVNAPVNPAWGNSSIRCTKTDSPDPLYAADLELLGREFVVGSSIPAQGAPNPLEEGRSVTIWQAKDKNDHRTATVTQFGDGQACISSNFHLK